MTPQHGVDHVVRKASRFAWRMGRNLLCAAPGGKSLLFPAASLANDFGPADADYSIRVFLHHYRQLSSCGFRSAQNVLEVGPGRNIGTAVLMWAINQLRAPGEVTVTLWDVFANARVDDAQVVASARSMLASPVFPDAMAAIPDSQFRAAVASIASGGIRPEIRYRVESLEALLRSGAVDGSGLIYSHSAIECVWHVDLFWNAMIELTRPGGWHSHRIDLSDLGRRESNYVEMLEWSPAAYWLTMRFVPGAINRWRAADHLAYLEGHGLELRHTEREVRDALPVPRVYLSAQFRALSDLELRTTALDVVATKPPIETAVVRRIR